MRVRRGDVQPAPADRSRLSCSEINFLELCARSTFEELRVNQLASIRMPRRREGQASSRECLVVEAVAVYDTNETVVHVCDARRSDPLSSRDPSLNFITDSMKADAVRIFSGESRE